MGISKKEAAEKAARIINSARVVCVSAGDLLFCPSPGGASQTDIDSWNHRISGVWTLREDFPERTKTIKALRKAGLSSGGVICDYFPNSATWAF